LIESCADQLKEFEKFCKNISEISKKNDGNNNKMNLNHDLNSECMIKKNHMFPRINTELRIFQDALNRHSENLLGIKFDYFIKTLDFINKQTKNIDDLVEEGR